MNDYKKLEIAIENEKNPQKANILKGFFKTGIGEYGEGDIFLGLTVPKQRKIAKEFKTIEIVDIQKLLDSKVHEKRLTGLLILIDKYKDSKKNNDVVTQKIIFDFYINNANKNNINNWDLVDLSAPNIVGDYLQNKDRKILYDLAKSKNLWERRIAIIATFAFIKKNDFIDTLKLCKILITDNHDLMHKACGWMLREVGKRDVKTLEGFLKENYLKMPRTMLRYSIEKFDYEKRQRYLKSLI